MTEASLARTVVVITRVSEYEPDVSIQGDVWVCTSLETWATYWQWGIKRLKPHPFEVGVFVAFVLPLSLGSWIKGVHNYKPVSITMWSEGPRGGGVGEIHISLLRGFPEDFYSLGIFDNPLAPHKN